MSEQTKLGKIKVYGKELDLDAIPGEELTQINQILLKRLDVVLGQLENDSEFAEEYAKAITDSNNF